ncbi:MAG: divalent-cation tolerance protein CutA [archaeon]
MSLRIVYVPAEKSNAKEIAEAVLREKLAACCNIFPCESMYWWGGKVETAKESALLIKTDEKRVQKLINRVKSIHKYDTPAIIVINPESVNNKYSKYMREVMGEQNGVV